jgi:pyrroloquinoline quinone (PQQ) biosynthesis protein C
MSSKGISEKLLTNQLRDELLNHPFFEQIRTVELTNDKVGVFLGQWWHPLHYFPTFLSRTIAVVPKMEMKTAISKILFQELGEGNPVRAHENIYIKTMNDVGFMREVVTDSIPFSATKQLVNGYEEASGNYLRGLGFLYGTEVADLAMVSGIGEAVRRVTDKKKLPWVDIHIAQEPDHVEKVNEATEPKFSPDEEALIVQSAEEMWSLWIAFFNQLSEAIFDVSSQPSKTVVLSQ